MAGIVGIVNYLKENKNTQLREIHCCLFSSAHYDLFYNAISAWKINNKDKNITLTGPIKLTP